MGLTMQDYKRLTNERFKNVDTSHTDDLSSTEQFWKDLQPWLASQGYMLRRRYHPDWTPSWKGGKKDIRDCEDGIHRPGPLMDATRMVDGACIVFKMVWTSSPFKETEIGQMFSNPPLSSDPANHCVPVLEVLRPPEWDDLNIVVMPLLRKFDNPPMMTVGEAIDFFQQMFEGLQLLHRLSIAHRDCTGTNIMMHSPKLFPEGFHPVKQHLTPDTRRTARHYTRTECPPKYYFIDFGLSIQYGQDDQDPTAMPLRGGDKSVPEFQGLGLTTPYNPFYTDVYYLGNTIKVNFIEKYRNFEFISEIVNDMTNQDPRKRPSMNEVFERFKEISNCLTISQLRARLSSRKEWILTKGVKDLAFLRKRVKYTFKRFPPCPSSEVERPVHAPYKAA